MSLPVYVHGHSDVGRARERNEDTFRVTSLPDGSWLLVVCDGMGGHEHGEIASAAAADRIVSSVCGSTLEPRQALFDALIEANQAVRTAARASGAEGTGTTCLAALIREGRCFVGYVGDSRLYQFRGGLPIERTRDHTRVQQWVASGAMTAEQAKGHPEAHVLVQALGGGIGDPHGFKPEVWAEPLALEEGDVLLLCSDGLYDLVDDRELYSCIESLDYQSAVGRLIDLANERGGADNITVVIAVAGSPEIPRRKAAAPPALAQVPVEPAGAVLTSAESPAKAPPGSAFAGQGAPPPPMLSPLARGVPLGWMALAVAVALIVGAALGWAARSSRWVAQASAAPQKGG